MRTATETKGFFIVRTIKVATGTYTQVQDAWLDISIRHADGESSDQALKRYATEAMEKAERLNRYAAFAVRAIGGVQ